jgi:hypothetical protein
MNDDEKETRDPMDPVALFAQVKLLQAALVVALRELRQTKQRLHEAEAVVLAMLPEGSVTLN